MFALTTYSTPSTRNAFTAIKEPAKENLAGHVDTHPPRERHCPAYARFCAGPKASLICLLHFQPPHFLFSLRQSVIAFLFLLVFYDFFFQIWRWSFACHVCETRKQWKRRREQFAVKNNCISVTWPVSLNDRARIFRNIRLAPLTVYLSRILRANRRSSYQHEVTTRNSLSHTLLGCVQLYLKYN